MRPEQTGWYVYRLSPSGKDRERASVQEFSSADRARRWAEVRLDRTGTNLRGPKPRAGRRSNCKLPDVRVTETERADAMRLLKDLGLTYSQFVRAALRFADSYIAHGTWEVVAGPDFADTDCRGSERSEEAVPDAPAPAAPAAPATPPLTAFSVFGPSGRPWWPPADPLK